MIIKELFGENLISVFLNSNDDRITDMAHGCNCFHSMGAGIAAEIRRRIPFAAFKDRRTPYGSIKKLGTFSDAIVPEATRNIEGQLPMPMARVYNLYTQYHTGRDARLDAVRKAFRNLDKVAIEGRKVGIPLIGCGIGGLEWDDVTDIINKETPNLDIVVFHFTPPRN